VTYVFDFPVFSKLARLVQYVDRGTLTLSLGATLTDKGMNMRTGKFENGLAILGVLIIVFAVGSAANQALAGEAGALDGTLKIESSTAN
jgi:hypothetical protein